MKNFSQIFTKYWTLIWLLTAVAAAGTVAVFADYTGVHSVKRVASTQQPSSSMAFSSNSLKPTTGNSTVSVAQKLSAQKYDITICNYEQNKAAQPNIEDIVYELTAVLQVRINGNYKDFSILNSGEKQQYIAETASRKLSPLDDTGKTYYISELVDNWASMSDADQMSYKEALMSGDWSKLTAEQQTSLVEKWMTQYFNERSYTIEMFENDNAEDNDVLSETNLVQQPNYTYTRVFHLKKETFSTDVFRISFDAEEFATNHTEPDFYISIRANPTSPSGIQPILNHYCAANPSVETSMWKGSLLETNCETVDYDFYIFILNGSGKGTIDVEWDSTMFEINPFFIEQEKDSIQIQDDGDSYITQVVKDDGKIWGKITLNVNSTEKSRYDIQFYKVSNTISSYTGTNNASKFIKTEFKSENSGTNENGQDNQNGG